MTVSMEMKRLLTTMVSKGGSDLLCTVGIPPTMRLQGRLRSLNLPKLLPEDTVGLMKSITPERKQQELDRGGTTDFGFAFDDQARFRVSAFKQKGCVGLVLRLIPSKFRTFEEIGLPQHIKNLLNRPRGLILVTGPTGCGKTTTLATMINFINEEMDKHIITVEDPIEYYHEHKKSIITQREIGVDVADFKEGIRRALRQNPDIILVGEMRDLETIEAAITAAETGHLVFGTLHTTGSGRTINRIVDAFPTQQQEQVRTQLATSLVSVISQVIIPTADGTGRVAAFEIMTMIPAIENLIRENKCFRIDSTIQTSSKQGMVLLDDFLYDLFREGRIAYAEMMRFSQYPEDLQKKVKDRRADLAGAGG